MNNDVEYRFKLLAYILKANIYDDSFKACCPGHDGKNNSFRAKKKENKILIHCLDGCEFDHIHSELGEIDSDFEWKVDRDSLLRKMFYPGEPGFVRRWKQK